MNEDEWVGEKLYTHDLISSDFEPTTPPYHCWTTINDDLHTILKRALDNWPDAYKILEALADPDVVSFEFEAQRGRYKASGTYAADRRPGVG